MIECCSELAQMPPEGTTSPRKWPVDPTTINHWGGPPPLEFILTGFPVASRTRAARVGHAARPHPSRKRISLVAVVGSLGAARPGEVRARLLGGLVSGVQAAVAAAAAWAAAGALGHERPLFAPIAALVTLGATASGRFARLD